MDAQCSFGKGLFKGLVNELHPSQVRFLKGSMLDFTLGLGCSIVVETSAGVWENFRALYAELYVKLGVSLHSNDATQRIKMSGTVEELKAVRVKIFKQKSPMLAEETSLLMLVNMGLGMLKSYAGQALEVPQVGYPSVKQ